MNCCANCFSDEELIDIISSNSTDTGDCDYCKTKNAHLANPRELEDMFMQLRQSYEYVSDNDKKGLDPYPFHEKIQRDWSIFSDLLKKEKQKKLLRDILVDLVNQNDPLFTEPVEQKVLTRELENIQTLKKWEDFTTEIKRNNRYFIGEEIDLSLLENLFYFYAESYFKGKLFYRARISDKAGCSIKKMGKPPYSKATSGRANPVGIPYLYVSTEKETVIYECRASHLDYITIAEFKLIEDLRFVSLRRTENISPFAIGDGLDRYLKHQKYLKKLESELSKPLRRQDQKIDYLPTQYICEFIKSLGYDAIEYGSALCNGGINLAIFNDVKLEPLKTEVREAISMNLQTEVIT